MPAKTKSAPTKKIVFGGDYNHLIDPQLLADTNAVAATRRKPKGRGRNKQPKETERNTDNESKVEAGNVRGRMLVAALPPPTNPETETKVETKTKNKHKTTKRKTLALPATINDETSHSNKRTKSNTLVEAKTTENPTSPQNMEPKDPLGLEPKAPLAVSLQNMDAVVTPAAAIATATPVSTGVGAAITTTTTTTTTLVPNESILSKLPFVKRREHHKQQLRGVKLVEEYQAMRQQLLTLETAEPFSVNLHTSTNNTLVTLDDASVKATLEKMRAKPNQGGYGSAQDYHRMESALKYLLIFCEVLLPETWIKEGIASNEHFPKSWYVDRTTLTDMCEFLYHRSHQANPYLKKTLTAFIPAYLDALWDKPGQYGSEWKKQLSIPTKGPDGQPSNPEAIGYEDVYMGLQYRPNALAFYKNVILPQKKKNGNNSTNANAGANTDKNSNSNKPDKDIKTNSQTSNIEDDDDELTSGSRRQRNKGLQITRQTSLKLQQQQKQQYPSNPALPANRYVPAQVARVPSEWSLKLPPLGPLVSNNNNHMAGSSTATAAATTTLSTIQTAARAAAEAARMAAAQAPSHSMSHSLEVLPPAVVPPAPPQQQIQLLGHSVLHCEAITRIDQEVSYTIAHPHTNAPMECRCLLVTLPYIHWYSPKAAIPAMINDKDEFILQWNYPTMVSWVDSNLPSTTRAVDIKYHSTGLSNLLYKYNQTTAPRLILLPQSHLLMIWVAPEIIWERLLRPRYDDVRSCFLGYFPEFRGFSLVPEMALPSLPSLPSLPMPMPVPVAMPMPISAATTTHTLVKSQPHDDLLGLVNLVDSAPIQTQPQTQSQQSQQPQQPQQQIAVQEKQEQEKEKDTRPPLETLMSDGHSNSQSHLLLPPLPSLSSAPNTPASTMSMPGPMPGPASMPGPSSSAQLGAPLCATASLLNPSMTMIGNAGAMHINNNNNNNNNETLRVLVKSEPIETHS